MEATERLLVVNCPFCCDMDEGVSIEELQCTCL